MHKMFKWPLKRPHHSWNDTLILLTNTHCDQYWKDVGLTFLKQTDVVLDSLLKKATLKLLATEVLTQIRHAAE